MPSFVFSVFRVNPIHTVDFSNCVHVMIFRCHLIPISYIHIYNSFARSFFRFPILWPLIRNSFFFSMRVFGRSSKRTEKKVGKIIIIWSKQNVHVIVSNFHFAYEWLSTSTAVNFSIRLNLNKPPKIDKRNLSAEQFPLCAETTRKLRNNWENSSGVTLINFLINFII